LIWNQQMSDTLHQFVVVKRDGLAAMLVDGSNRGSGVRRHLFDLSEGKQASGSIRG
jgi:hypothetical protein